MGTSGSARRYRNRRVVIVNPGPMAIWGLIVAGGLVARLCFRVVLGVANEHPDAPDPIGCLRAGKARPNSRCAAEKGEKLAPLHAGGAGLPSSWPARGVSKPRAGGDRQTCSTRLPRTQTYQS